MWAVVSTRRKMVSIGRTLRTWKEQKEDGVEEGEKTEVLLKVDRAGRERGRESEQERRRDKRLCTFECTRPAQSPFRHRTRNIDETRKQKREEGKQTETYPIPKS